MAILVLFEQDKWLESSPEGGALIHQKSMRLGHAEELPIVAERSRRHWGLEVVLCYGEHSLQVEHNRIACQVDCNEDDSRGVYGDGADLVMSLEGQDPGVIAGEIDLLDIVEDWGVEGIPVEEDIA